MTIAALVLMALALLIATGNIVGVTQALLRQRHGTPGGYSTVPLFSIFFASAAWFLAGDRIAFGTWLPAVIDPATWSLVILPFYLIWRVIGRPANRHFPPL